MNNKLREARKEHGMSLSELARRTNVSRQTLTLIELHGQEPSGSTMLSIAEALNLDPRDIFFTDNVIHGLRGKKKAM